MLEKVTSDLQIYRNTKHTLRNTANRLRNCYSFQCDNDSLLPLSFSSPFCPQSHLPLLLDSAGVSRRGGAPCRVDANGVTEHEIRTIQRECLVHNPCPRRVYFGRRAGRLALSCTLSLCFPTSCHLLHQGPEGSICYCC